MGFQALWGSFGQRALRFLRSVAEPILEAVHLGKVGGIEVTPETTYRELGRIYREEESAPLIAALSRGETVPGSLYTESDIPWKHPYAYEVEMYGRDVATGRFTHTGRILTFSRELTTGEVLDEAEARFGASGSYPQVDIKQMSLIGAYTRAGEVR